MRLTDLLNFDDIVIQCHDKPDADAIASGFALLKYLEGKGKSPRLVYTGAERIRRGSLQALLARFEIPLTYLDTPEGEAGLLVTVDCRAGERNVTALPHRALAVIDHHTAGDGERLPELCDVRTEGDGYGSCATVVWAMLKEAGFPVEEDRVLPSLLYYGLYMDTQELKTARKMDKMMLDELHYDMDIVTELQSVNLSLEELGILGRAYDSLHISPRHRFAVAQVEPCDPDLLGIVSDELMKVAGVDVSAAYCILDGEQGAKVSLRCRRSGYSAAELVHWLVRDMGSDGGGAPTKAAGRLPRAFLEEACAGDGWDDLSGAAGRLIYRLLTDYFETPPRQLPSGEYDTGTVAELCAAEPALYRKKKVPVGYVKATDLFPEGEEILLRMLEGDVRKTVTDALYIMIGVDGETYHNEAAGLRENYDLLDTPFPTDPESPWQPKVYRYADRQVRLLSPHAKTCVAKDDALIWAAPLKGRTEVLSKWGERHLGEAGDWLVSRDTDRQDIYIIKHSPFERTYERAEE